MTKSDGFIQLKDSISYVYLKGKEKNIRITLKTMGFICRMY